VGSKHEGPWRRSPMFLLEINQWFVIWRFHLCDNVIAGSAHDSQICRRRDAMHADYLEDD
jgi:hypothetical protein